MGQRKKTISDYEAEAVWVVGECLIGAGLDSRSRTIWHLRHRPNEPKLPSTVEICHTCDHPRCILDEHHFVGSHLDNMQDAVKKGKFVRSTPERRTLYVGANNGMYGKTHSKAARKAMSKARKGVPFTVEHVANLIAANRSSKRRVEASKQRKGKPLSAKHLRHLQMALKKPTVRAKMSAAHTGVAWSPAMRLSQESRIGRSFETMSLLRSGYGHPWRLATLAAKTRAMVESL